MPETNLTENSPKEDYFTQTIYPKIINCFPREEMNRFLEGKNITYQEILSFFDKKEIMEITESLGSFNQSQGFKNVKTRASSLFNS